MDPEISLTQFHGVFFEECSEAIEVMEKELLNLDMGKVDPEIINTIFRAAHSIKGGAGTFGFARLADFTHNMETVLDEMRDGRQEVTQEAVALLLSSVDCLRSIIDCSKNDKPFDEEVISDLQQKLEVLIQNASEIPSEAITRAKVEQANGKESNIQTSYNAWHITFYPHENLFFSGNDPLRLIRELTNLGKLEISVNKNRVPEFNELNPEMCYLGWEMILHGDATREEVREVFAWVEGDSELHIDLEHDRRANIGRRTDDEEQISTTGRRGTDRRAPVVQTTTSIRVGIDKVDKLVNLVGELVITQSILSRVCGDLGLSNREKLSDILEQLERHTRDLQEQAMSIRMLPVDFAFQRLPRVVHDLSHLLGKQVKLQFSGETTELDKTVLEKIGDPLVHLVRNALDHGIEQPETRVAAGKDEAGLISVSAYHQGGNIIVEVSDDGAGLDSQKILDKAIEKGLVDNNEELSDIQIQSLIFRPGFSTAQEVSDISGRGVGMDVVQRNITDLGGTVDVFSEAGHGSTFIISLPLTLAILDGQMVRIGHHIYIIPLLSIVESLQVMDDQVSDIAGSAELYQYRDEYIPIIRLDSVFNIEAGEQEDRGLLVVVDIGRKRIGLFVDEVIGQQQVVIKSLDENYRHVMGLAGATVLGDGSVALILDVPGLSQHYFSHEVFQQVAVQNKALH